MTAPKPLFNVRVIGLTLKNPVKPSGNWQVGLLQYTSPHVIVTAVTFRLLSSWGVVLLRYVEH
jgi:hypothetical protein